MQDVTRECGIERMLLTRSLKVLLFVLGGYHNLMSEEEPFNIEGEVPRTEIPDALREAADQIESGDIK